MSVCWLCVRVRVRARGVCVCVFVCIRVCVYSPLPFLVQSLPAAIGQGRREVGREGNDRSCPLFPFGHFDLGPQRWVPSAPGPGTATPDLCLYCPSNRRWLRSESKGDTGVLLFI